jgi:hypothetical protein
MCVDLPVRHALAWPVTASEIAKAADFVVLLRTPEILGTLFLGDDAVDDVNWNEARLREISEVDALKRGCALPLVRWE